MKLKTRFGIETNSHSGIADCKARVSANFFDNELQSGCQLLTGYNHALQLQGNLLREKPAYFSLPYKHHAAQSTCRMK